jgi:hypothetical protein
MKTLRRERHGKKKINKGQMMNKKELKTEKLRGEEKRT